jgi:protein kinase
MERYKILKTVGDGSFGTVVKAVNRSTGEVVAIKKMKQKFYSWDECLALREIKSLRKLSHNNIIKVKEVIRANDELHLIFEFLEQNIYQFIKDRSEPLPERRIRAILYQVFSGLAYMHKHGFFHRDLKPENLLVQNEVCKLADFGLAREIRSKPPFTDYVSTRWYRAPEILLRSTSYNSPIDQFAMGCIMAELYTLKPLAPGSNEHDQVHKLCAVLGTPTKQQWADGLRLAQLMNFHFPQAPGVPLPQLLPNMCSEGLNLISQLLEWDPQNRPSASQVLQHPYFANFQPILESPPNSRGPNSRGVLESRGLVSGLRQTHSKVSRDSSSISKKSSRGNMRNINPSSIRAAEFRGELPKLNEETDFKLPEITRKPLAHHPPPYAPPSYGPSSFGYQQQQPVPYQPPYQPPSYQPPYQPPSYQPPYQTPSYQPSYQAPSYQPPYQAPSYQPPYQTPSYQPQAPVYKPYQGGYPRENPQGPPGMQREETHLPSLKQAGSMSNAMALGRNRPRGKLPGVGVLPGLPRRY